MENTRRRTVVSGSLLVLGFVSVLGIIASAIYSGYLGIACGVLAMLLAAATREPKIQSERIVVFGLAAASLILGASAIGLGVVARTLSSIIQAGN